MQKDDSVSVLDEPLEMCGEHPVTRFFRDSHCITCDEDVGPHTVCIETNKIFLNYSKTKGNDLSTPAPEFGFKGLRWCLCAATLA